MHVSSSAVLSLALVATSALAQSTDEPRQAAEAYLAALTGDGDESGKDLLLGGTTMDAQMFTLDNARIVSREKGRKEDADLASAQKLVAALDESGRKALTRLMNV